MVDVRLWITISWSFMLRMLKILTHTYTNSTARGQSTLKDVTERYFRNGLSREALKAMKAFYALYALYANVIVEKTYPMLKLIPNCIYSMYIMYYA